MKIEKKIRNKQCENLNNKKYVNPYKYDFIFRIGECVCVCVCVFLLFTKRYPVVAVMEIGVRCWLI